MNFADDACPAALVGFSRGKHPPPLHDVVQRLAFDVLHGIVRGAMVLAGDVEADDVAMVKLLENFGLAFETRQGCFVAKRTGDHDLDGYFLTGFPVLGAVDRTHSAAAYLLLDFERSD